MIDKSRLKKFLNKKSKKDLIDYCHLNGLKSLSSLDKNKITELLLVEKKGFVLKKFILHKIRENIWFIPLLAFGFTLFVYFSTYKNNESVKNEVNQLLFENYGVYDYYSKNRIESYIFTCFCDGEFEKSEYGYLNTDSLTLQNLPIVRQKIKFYLYSPIPPLDGQYHFFHDLNINKYSKTLLAKGDNTNASIKKIAAELYLIEPVEYLSKGKYSFFNKKEESGYLFNFE